MNVLSLLKNKKNRLSNYERLVLASVLGAVLVGISLPGHLIVSTSPSLNHRIFFLSKAVHLKTGDTVVFKHKIVEPKLVKKTLNPNKDQFIKIIGCSPGEHLKRDHDIFYCQGKKLGKALAQDSKGDKLPQFYFDGKVPENSYFMIGQNPRSYDSKYFGFIKNDLFLHKALPIW